MTTRRQFLYAAAVSVPVFSMFGCEKHKPVLKIPENATECVDMFNFFSDPKLNFEQAKVTLGLTGAPKVLQSTSTWRRHFFEEQPGPASKVELNTSIDKDRGEFLSGIYINYSVPINVAFDNNHGFGNADRACR